MGCGLSEFLEAVGAHTCSFVQVVQFVGVVGALRTHHLPTFSAMMLNNINERGMVRQSEGTGEE